MRTIAAGLAAAAVGAAGCGGSGSAPAGTRPPAPINVTASLTPARVSISPARIGAGPITLIVANLSRRSLELTLRPLPFGGERASSGPINPQGTAELSVDVPPGAYRLAARGSAARPATLRVGGERSSAQNDLLLP